VPRGGRLDRVAAVCRIGLDQPVPHPTTLIKLVRRAGPQVVAQLNAALLEKLAGDKLLRGRKLRWPRRPSVSCDTAAAPPQDIGCREDTSSAMPSSMSMRHWADPTAGLAEIGCVLRPGARALVGTSAPASHRSTRTRPIGSKHTRCSQLQIVSATPWRWPWRLILTQRWSSSASMA
jgi:hypothetical protein